MRMMGMVTVLMGILGHGSAQGSTHSTQWTLHNEARTPISLSCRNMSVQAMDIVLPERTLAAGERIVHDWGDRYYNDGMWLNPGRWTCAVRTEGLKSASKRTESFSTDWGESISIVLNLVEDEVRLRKVPTKAPVATRDAADGKAKDSK